MSIQDNQRPLEEGIHTYLAGRMSYAGYLSLDLLVAA
jgi:tryptophan 2,3-dioxygenase